MELKPGDLVLVKADAFKGKRKIKDRWEDETCEVGHQIMTDVPLLQSDRPMQTVMHPPPQSTSHCIRDWHSLVCGCLPSMGLMYQPHPS